jgi:hypothetical protein
MAQMNFLERAQIFLAGMLFSLGLAHFEVVADFNQAAFWVTGAAIGCWVVGALLKDRGKNAELSTSVGDPKGT